MNKEYRQTNKIENRQYLHSIGCMLTFFLLFLGNIKVQAQKEEDNKPYQFSNQHVYDLEIKLTTHRTNNDTIAIIKTLSHLGEIYSHRANYAKSYNYYWEALLLADKTDDRHLLATVHENIGWLYSYFDREEESLTYFEKTLQIKKQLITNDSVDKVDLIPTYYAITTFYREAKEFDTAKQYLDSCYFLVYQGHTRKFTLNYLDAELGYYFLHKGQYQKAMKTLKGVEPYFQEKLPSYLTILYSKMADIYSFTNQYSKSEEYYKKSLKISEFHQSHQNYAPQVYEKLATLYEKTNHYNKAYHAIQKAKFLNDQLFDSRNENNRELLAISDLYREDQQKQEQEKQKQVLEQLAHQNKVQNLKNIILTLIFLVILLLGLLYIRQMRIKFKLEKEVAIRKQELEQEQDRELLKIKNKELTTSALRLIQKDESMHEIEEYLKSLKIMKSDPKLKRLFKTATDDQKEMWCEFDRRFVEVNQSFHHQLSALHPSLTPGDRKLCALLKLNFSSKEISQLLGISVESVHTQRYRLRKKMKLNKETNLVNYLSALESNLKHDN